MENGSRNGFDGNLLNEGKKINMVHILILYISFSIRTYVTMKKKK